MNFRRIRKIFIFLFLGAAALALVFIAAVGRSDDYEPNFEAVLHVADDYCAKEKFDDAITVLRRASRRNLAVVNYLSIFKRFRKIGEKKLAKSILEKALRHFPDDETLLAVAAQFFLREENLRAAQKYANPLRSGEFASLLAETRFAAISDPDAFCNPELVKDYIAAAKCTGENAFLQSAAAILAGTGRIDEAAELHPAILLSDDDHVFWAKILFDAKRFEAAHKDLRGFDGEKDLAFFADVALMSGKLDEAGAYWQQICDSDDDGPASNSLLAHRNLIELFRQKGDVSARNGQFQTAMQKFPDDVSLLNLFAEFADEMNQSEKRDSFSEILRSRDLPTLAMRDFDRRLKIDPALPLQLAEAAYERTKNPQFLVEILKCKNRLEDISPEMVHKGEIMKILSQDALSDDAVRYCVWILLRQGDFFDASAAFFDYVEKKYGIAPQDFENIPSEVPGWELEYFAILAAADVPSSRFPDYEAAIHCMQRLSEKGECDETAMLNFALFLESAFEYEKALKICNGVAAKTDEMALKSAAEFRKGRIYHDCGDDQKATASLSLALKLYPDNSDARFLLAKIRRR